MSEYKWKPFNLLVSVEEVKGNEMKIEAGKYYKTRDGRKVGPTEVSEYNTSYPKAKFWVEDYGLIQENGKFGNDEDTPELDLISEWQDKAPSPIRTVTRREIVPGVYGKVFINDYDELANTVSLNVKDDFGCVSFNAEELRETAHILNQIAEVLEDNGE